MIGSLRGIVLDRANRPAGGGEILIEVAGVGYRVLVPTGAEVGPLGSSTFVHVHTHVREDAIVLYGFPTRDERNCFEALIGAHGVGPAVALALLSVHSPTALRRAVQSEDVDALTLVPGIGPKTAKRLVIELKSRLDTDDELSDLEVVASSDGRRADGPGAIRADVRNALATLGYGADEIRQAIAALPEDGSVEEHLRMALRELADAR